MFASLAVDQGEPPAQDPRQWTIRNDPDRKDILRDALKRVADADHADIDWEACTFELSYSEDASDEGVPGWRRNVRERFFPPDALGEQSLRRYTPMQRASAQNAVRRVWGAMLEELWAATLANRLILWARPLSPLASLQAIDQGSWRYFAIEDWRGGIAHCQFGDERLFDVRIGEAHEAERIDQVPRNEDSALRSANLQKWFEERELRWPEDAPYPNEATDWEDAKAFFQTSIPRSELRRARQIGTSSEWRAPGPRGPHRPPPVKTIRPK